MEKLKIKLKKFFAHKIFRILKWAFFVLIILYLILVAFRVVEMFRVDKTNTQVDVIHSTKISIDDVMGTNLPPDPGAEANKTVKGIDANYNGIRDDVELAIFEKYPDSAKTRASLLQYALAQQMQFIQPFLNTVIATEVIREHSRADTCLSDTLAPRQPPDFSRDTPEMEKIDLYISFIEDIQFNNEERNNLSNSFFEKVRSYSPIEGEACDIDYFKLPN